MSHLSHREAVCQWYETQVYRDLIIKASQMYMYTTPKATRVPVTDFEQTVQNNVTDPWWKAKQFALVLYYNVCNVVEEQMQFAGAAVLTVKAKPLTGL